jgi:hypothetical protein
MIVLHMENIRTRYNGILHTRYFFNLFKYFSEKNAKFIEIKDFKGLDNVNEDIVIIDPNGHPIKNEIYQLIKILNKYKLNKYNFKLFYIAGDIWPVEHNIYLHNIIQTILKADNYKVIHVSLNIGHLCNIWDKFFNLNKYINNFSYLQFNYYYDGIEIDYNPTPINKVILSGNININIYPERLQLKELNLPNVYHLEFCQLSEYTKELNKYLCSFVSNVSMWNPGTKSKVNTKFLLLKYLEVLASGSLLLAEKCIQKEFETIGLISGLNCYMTSMNDIKSSIDYILNPENIDKINEIRLNGYNFYKDYKIRMDNDFNNMFKDIQ